VQKVVRVSSRVKARGILIAAIVSLVVVGIGSAAVVQSVREDGSDQDGASGSSSSPQRSVSVPQVVGLTEGAAVKALGESKLVANVRFDKDAPRTGKVLRSEPSAGDELRAGSPVVLTIALAPRLPAPGPGHEQDLQPFNSLVEDHPEAFVGLYRDEEGIPHAVFGPGVDPALWRDRLAAAAEGLPYRTDTCPRSHASLRALQDEIAKAAWTKNKRLGFGVVVHPATCTVRVESDLLSPTDIRALVERYGTAISIDTTEGSHPVPLTD
jgi:PASTA domain-containing protein